MKITKDRLKQIIKEEMKRLGTIQEARKIDIAYAAKNLKTFNKGNIEFDEMVKNVMKDLMISLTHDNYKKVHDHLTYSSNGQSYFKPKDITTIIRELYDIIYNY